MDVTGFSPPFLIKAVGKNSEDEDIELYSASSGGGTANINPATNLAIALAAGDCNLSDIYENYTGSPSLTEIDNALNMIGSALELVLEAYAVADTNPFTDSFVIGNALDKLFDDLKIGFEPVHCNVRFTNSTGSILGTTTLDDFSSFPGIVFKIEGIGQDDSGIDPDYRLDLIIDTLSFGTSSLLYYDEDEMQEFELKSISITDVIMTGNNVTFKGTGLVDGVDSHLFTITITDGITDTMEVVVNGASYNSGSIDINEGGFTIIRSKRVSS
jgi:hypothetical protein